MADFPEPVHYSRTDCPTGWTIRDWETANKLLSYFEPIRRPFAIFTLPNNSYVQTLGAKRRLTVEAREYHRNGSFTHWVFGHAMPLGILESIEVSTGTLTVDTTQLLAMRDARVIIRQFLETRTFPLSYHRQDVTERFQSKDKLGLKFRTKVPGNDKQSSLEINEPAVDSLSKDCW